MKEHKLQILAIPEIISIIKRSLVFYSSESKLCLLWPVIKRKLKNLIKLEKQFLKRKLNMAINLWKKTGRNERNNQTIKADKQWKTLSNISKFYKHSMINSDGERNRMKNK